MIPESAIAIIKEFEGLSLKAYRCPAGVWTIGYGSTRINGRPIKERDVLSGDRQAETLLIAQLQTEYLPKLEIIPGWRQMSDNQKSALISFAWNLGAHFYGASGFDTITKHLKGKQWHLVPGAMKLYVKAGGQTLPGLARRRQAEADLWDRGLNLIENEGKPITTPPPMKEDSPVGLFYFLDFTMGLDEDGRLEDGRLVLRSISAQGGRTHQIWVSTTSIASRQKPEDFHQRGGPIPPEYRVPSLRAWEVETVPINLAHVKGVEGSFYKILPFEVRTDKGGVRGDFGIHKDPVPGTPGSLGCIVMSDARFKDFESEMKRLKDLGYGKVPLFVTYPTN